MVDLLGARPLQARGPRPVPNGPLGKTGIEFYAKMMHEGYIGNNINHLVSCIQAYIFLFNKILLTCSKAQRKKNRRLTHKRNILEQSGEARITSNLQSNAFISLTKLTRF